MMKMTMTGLALAVGFVLGFSFGGSPAHAQLAGDQYYGFERDPVTAPRGADDSTTGAQAVTAEEAEIGLSPSALHWSGLPDDPQARVPKTVTITNLGRLFSLGQISVSLSNSNFTLVGNSCDRLTSGQSCEVILAPHASQTGEFDGQLTVSSESGKTAFVPLTANIQPPPPPPMIWVDIRDQRCIGNCSVDFNMWDYFDRIYTPDEIDHVRMIHTFGQGVDVGAGYWEGVCWASALSPDYSGYPTHIFGSEGGTSTKTYGGGKGYGATGNMDTISGEVRIQVGAWGWGGCGCRGCIDRIMIGIQPKG